MTMSPPAQTCREIHIDSVKAGDTVRCPDGIDRTVCAKDIRRDPFIGTTLWGDSYMCGHRPVNLVEFQPLQPA
jgi:hypothetical protein